MSILSMRLSTVLVSALRYNINPATIPFLSQVPRVKHYSIPSMFRPSHTCDIDAEPFHRYRPGGYHPILLGDLFKNQRYKVIQKIGWGGNSTTWVARDQLHSPNVTLKVSVSDKSSNNKANVLSAIYKLSEEYPRQDHPGRHHLVRMLDHFTVDRPDGIHDCLVLELLGPSVPDVIESLYSDGRLPADLAKSTAYRALLGIDVLSSHKIGHGVRPPFEEYHICFTEPCHFGRVTFLEMFGRPETTPVGSVDGIALTTHLPNYIVRPIFFPVRSMREGLRTSTVKIIDFGEAFFPSQNAVAVHTPLAVRALEAIFDDWIDYRVDMWSMDFLLVEPVAGQPLFDKVMANSCYPGVGDDGIFAATSCLIGGERNWIQRWLGEPGLLVVPLVRCWIS
ncbi:kinase-like domain-containing protein [Xylariaceae sp. FL1651]|nr:kinase-like domain-containing protein [Xylariaceae sp. FL1651]